MYPNECGRVTRKWGSGGTGKVQFDNPDGITFDAATGFLYVADRKNHRILIFNQDGGPIYDIDLAKTTKGLDIKPRDVAIDNEGKYVVDKTNSRIHVFTTHSLPS